MPFGRTTPWLTPRYAGDLARGRGPRSGPWSVQPASVMSGAVAASDLALLTIVMFVEDPGAPWGVLVFLVLAGSILAARGQFRSRIALTLAGDVGPILASVAAALVLVSILGGFDHHVGAALHAGIVASVIIVSARATLYAAFRAVRVHGLLNERALIIGTGPLAARFACLLREHREYGLEPVGFLDDAEERRSLPAPLLGRTAHLPSVIVEHGIQRVVIAFGAAREADMVDIVRACVDASVNVHMLPRFYELGWTSKHGQMDDVWGYPLVRLPQSAWRPPGRVAKRSLDIAVASAALLVVAPLYVALAVAVKLSSPGPVYFRQERVGERSRPVEILKFRSMRVNEDADVTWDVGGDERITAVGRFMRDFSLDELPQLWNIVRGDMSLVGPRPERPYFVERFRSEIHHYDRRHRMPGGLTGLAQVHGLRVARTSIEDRARLDNHYIQTWSFWRDVSILVRTPFVVLHHAWRDRANARPYRERARLPAAKRTPSPPRVERRVPGTKVGGRAAGSLAREPVTEELGSAKSLADGVVAVETSAVESGTEEMVADEEVTEETEEIVTDEIVTEEIAPEEPASGMVPLLVGGSYDDAEGRAAEGGSPARPV